MIWKQYSPRFEYEEMCPDMDSAWSGHKFFAYELVANKKPKIIVELGTHKGTSLFSFCQAIKDFNLHTKIVAVDTWKGDHHAGFYGEEVFRNVQKIKDTFYATINLTLERSTFDAAVDLFENTSIGLLHIDGLHTYEAVKHDFDMWLEKVSNSGIILFHDITERKDDFGVYKLWDELKGKYKTMEFYHSHGLGILFKTPYNFEGDFDFQEIWRRYYEMKTENKTLRSMVEQKERIIDELQQVMHDKDIIVQKKDVAIQEKETTIQEQESTVQTMHMTIDALRHSWSWRLTVPLRMIGYFPQLLKDIPLAWQLLCREGVRSFINRTYHYLRGQRFPSTFTVSQKAGITRSERYQLYRQKYKAAKIHAPDQINELTYQPVISILTPVYNVDSCWLDRCIQSVMNQYYPYWELCLVDDASSRQETVQCLQRWQHRDKRIKIVFNEKNSGISVTTNTCLSLATGAYIALLDNDDELAPEALLAVVKKLKEEPQADFIYSDEDKIIENRNGSISYFEPFFKPDWSPQLLFSFMYTGHLTVYRKKIVEDLGGFRSQFDFSQDYDLALRVSEVTKNIVHIPEVLYHWRSISSSAASGGKSYARESNLAALRSACERRGYEADVMEYPFANRVKFRITTVTLISIIIPSDNANHIQHTVDLILKNTSYSSYEVIVVTNTLVIKDIRLKYRNENRVRWEPFDHPFNFSAKCNDGAAVAKGEYVLFLNDDIEVEQCDWLENLISVFGKGNVGGVSPKLFYENNTIQYAGMVTGVRGLIGTACHMWSKDSNDYFNFAQSERNTSLLSGACLIMPKKVFSEIGGFDAIHTPIMHSDIDLCFKLSERGYEMIYTPFVSLRHIGHVSLQETDKQKPLKKDIVDVYIMQKWGKYLERDPYFTDNMRFLLYHDGTSNFTFYAISSNLALFKKNILLVSHELSLTGAPLLLYYFAEYLQQQGYFVTVISPHDGPLRQQYIYINIPVIIDETLHLTPSIEIKKLMKNYDLVLVNTLTMYPAILAANEIHIPSLYFVHESHFGIKMLHDNDAIRQALQKASKCLIIGQESFVLYKKYNSNFTVLGYGTKGFIPKDHIRRANHLTIIHIGSVEKRKGQDILLTAYLSLSPRDQDKIDLYFIGQTLQPDYWHELMTKSSGNSHIHWLGQQSRSQVEEWIHQADVFVCSSRDEVGPITVLEAMSAGKAVISTRVGGVATMIDNGENGYIVDNEDTIALAQKMKYLIDHPEEISRVGKKAAQKFKDHFTMEKLNEQIFSVIQSII